MQRFQGFLIAIILVLIIVIWKSFPTRDLYVSDIGDIEIVAWEWKEPLLDKSIDGNSLIINEKFYEKGIGLHASCHISVPVPPGYTTFSSDIGIDDEIAPDAPATVKFIVIGDGVVLYESDVIKPDMKPYRIHVNVKWISKLDLIVTDAGDGTNSDHADWANARFIP